MLPVKIIDLNIFPLSLLALFMLQRQRVEERQSLPNFSSTTDTAYKYQCNLLLSIARFPEGDPAIL